MVVWPAAWRRAGIVHQHGDLAPGVIDAVLERLHALRTADIGRHGKKGGRAELTGGPVERFGRQIGQADLEAEGREAPGRRETDAAGGAGHDRDAAGCQGGMDGHGNPFFHYFLSTIAHRD
jgi:hypothetical protein